MQETLESMRKEINEIDAAMLRLFAERMAVVSRISDYKEQQGIAVQNTQREAEIKANIKNCVSEPYVDAATDFINETLRISREFQQTRRSKMY